MKIRKGSSFDYVVIDRDNETDFRKHTWHIDKHGYCVGSWKIGMALSVFGDGEMRAVYKKFYMHHLVHGDQKEEAELIGHIDGNRLNNTRENVKPMTYSEMHMRKKRLEKYKSKYIGVNWNNENHNWVCVVNKKHEGVFKDELHAAWRFNECVDRDYPNDAVWQARKNSIDKPDGYQTPTLGKLGGLPRGLMYNQSHKTYYVQVAKRRSTEMKSLDDALKVLTEYREDEEKQKARKQEEFLKQPITRNLVGAAVLRTSKWTGDMTPEEKSREEVIVDDDQWHKLVMAGKCHVVLQKGGNYAGVIRGKLIHRYILGLSDSTQWVDHSNRNRLDNRRANLLVASRNAPRHNSNKNLKTPKSTSQYRGVSWKSKDKKWMAQMSCQGQSTHMKFDKEIDAALQYDAWAQHCLGADAVLNFPNGPPTEEEDIKESDDEPPHKRSKVSTDFSSSSLPN